MPIHVNASGWRVRRGGTARGATSAAAPDLPGVPSEFLTDESEVAEEVVLEPAAATRGRDVAPGALDISYDVPPGETAVLAIRHPSGALTFHLPVESHTRGVRGPAQVRFQVAIRETGATRGLVGKAVKAIVIKVAKVAANKAVSFVVPKLTELLEREIWKKRGLKEGWLKVTKESLAAGALASGKPVSGARSLLLIHGTFSNATACYQHLASSNFFERVKDAYDDRIFAFDHFSLSRTPEQNAKMLLEGLPDQTTTFDVITHSRGGLVLRHLVERTKQLGDVSRRFKLGRAVLVASPNDGTPLATPARWEETVGWLANLLELFPDNPFTTGAAFVANGIVWLANHASGDVPGLHSMDGQGDLIAAIQSPPGPPADAYSALVSNYQPPESVLKRLLDVGIDQFFASANDLVVPSEGGWRVDRSAGFVPASRIGCFGPGGNLATDSVTHVDFFSHPETVDFLVNALLGRQHALTAVDPRKSLPLRRMARGGISDVSARAALPAAAATSPDSDVPALRVVVVNGDLTFEAEPLLLGHYHATKLTGTERVMNRLIGGSMERSLNMGVYPVAIGTHQVFINRRPNLERGNFMPRPSAVLIVGLGEEGKLRAAELVQTVRQAVIAWAQRLAETGKRRDDSFTLAATLLGSGGTGITPGDSARLIAQGVHEANEALLRNAQGRESGWPGVRELRLIELYLDRATEAWRSLRLQAAATPGRYDIEDSVRPGTGPMQRTGDSGYRGAEFDFITVETRPDKDGVPLVTYTLDTKRARSEVRGQRAQSDLLTELVLTASNDQNRDEKIGRTLFNLLIPIELEPYLAGSSEMQIELDPQNAKIPWELLETPAQSEQDEPWSIRVKLLRKLRLAQFRERVTDADAEANILVVGEPECPAEYPRLYGARNEALAVCGCLNDFVVDKSSVTSLISNDPSQPGPNARTVVNTIFDKPWRIVHIAGHGAPGESGKPGGVVLSNGTFLGPDEIGNMRTVPELVFVNCCHLGSADAGQLLKTGYDRAEFASGVAGALIAIGVRCVVAAGWAVDDEVASVFAQEFYRSLLGGTRFIDAVGHARKIAYEHNTNVNTWAAYQCYGDPEWVFRRSGADANAGSTPPAEDFSGVGSALSLKLALERIIVRTRFQGADVVEQLNNLTQLEKLFGAKWGGRGDVAELFAEGFVEAGDVETGMHWYERAVTATDARASIKAAEQLANIKGRLAWEIVDKASRNLEALKAKTSAKRARVDAERSLRQAVKRADELLDESLALLNKLIGLEQTMERASLIGSVYKRRVLVHSAAGRRGQIQRDLQQMKARYQDAQRIGEKDGLASAYYPASNRLAADAALLAMSRGRKAFDRDTAEFVRKQLKADGADNPNFWSVVGEIEIDQYEALAKRKLGAERSRLERAYDDLHKRVTATRMWGSVYDTACLVLPAYANRATGKEKAAAQVLLAKLREFAHPEGVN